MNDNKLLNYTFACNEYLKATEQYIKGWSDEQLAEELNAFDKIWEHEELKHSFFLGDTDIEQILINEAVERFKASALKIKGE